MDEQVKRFMEKVRADEALRERLNALVSLPEGEIAEKSAVIAREAGFDLAKDDFASGKAELDERELDAVSGGGRQIVTPFFKCASQAQNTLYCATCKFSQFDWPNLYCMLIQREMQPAEGMHLPFDGKPQ